MKLTIEYVKNSLASFLAVLFLFGGGWYHLDQLRLAASKEQQAALKLKMEADFKLQKYEDKNKEFEIKKKEFEKAVQEFSEKYREKTRDKELSDLTLKYIDEVSGIDLHTQCADDPEHNTRVRKAEALLNLIQAKAIEYDRIELVNTFIKRQRSGFYHWSENCKY